MPYLSASAVVIHYEEALYQVYGPLPLPFTFTPTHPDTMSHIHTRTCVYIHTFKLIAILAPPYYTVVANHKVIVYPSAWLHARFKLN